MRIAFLDPANWQYTVDTPYERPFGGSQSALCYLAAELARLGHSITIFNGNTAPSESHGVLLKNISEISAPNASANFDIAVVLNAAIGRQLRQDARIGIPLVLWNQHSHDQEAVRPLGRLNERNAWTGFAFVSDWQRENFERLYWIPHEKIHVLRNAVSPAFLERANAPPWFTTGDAPTLFYTSTPFRGLDVLLRSFPAVRTALPGARLRIFSSMGVYQLRAEDDQYRQLYNEARATDGVEYVGSLGQSRLAQELAGTAALAYPSTFEETFCTAAIEALASGATVITTRLGALPETTGGHATLIDWQSDKAKLAESFAAATIVTLRAVLENPAAASAKRDEQINYVGDRFTWPVRAREWETWLSQLLGRS